MRIWSCFKVFLHVAVVCWCTCQLISVHVHPNNRQQDFAVRIGRDRNTSNAVYTQRYASTTYSNQLIILSHEVDIIPGNVTVTKLFQPQARCNTHFHDLWDAKRSCIRQRKSCNIDFTVYHLHGHIHSAWPWSLVHWTVQLLVLVF